MTKLNDLYKAWYFIRLFVDKQDTECLYYTRLEKVDGVIECKTDNEYEAESFNTLEEARIVAKRIKQEWSINKVYIVSHYVRRSSGETIEKVW